MGAQKLDLEEIQYLSYIPKELAQFWQAYFSNLSVSLGKLFYKYTKEIATVRYMHRDLVDAETYFEAVGESSLIKSFALSQNANDMGFLLFSEELCYYLMNSILGGCKSKNYEFDRRKMGLIDPLLLETVLDDILIVLKKEMALNYKNLFFHVLSKNTDKDLILYLKKYKIMSIQQFMCIIGNQSFVFDIAFTDKAIERIALS